ncbi:MAG: hypothetical protein JG777_3215, partial [Clostridia bacterium]|nr:hypothetical protein [Clostridia bacterium]
NSVNEPNKLQHNERSKYSDQSEIRVLTTGGTLFFICMANIEQESFKRVVETKCRLVKSFSNNIEL